MSAVDFAEWAAPDLVLKNLGGHTFTVCPPTVGDMAKLLALAIRGEVELGLVPKDTEIPDAVQELIDQIGPTDHPALGGTYAAMKEAGLNDATINRAAYYVIFYWARGKRYADALATLLWAPRTDDEGSDAKAPADGGGAPRKG